MTLAPSFKAGFSRQQNFLRRVSDAMTLARSFKAGDQASSNRRVASATTDYAARPSTVADATNENILMLVHPALKDRAKLMLPLRGGENHYRSEERRVGKEC